MSRTLKITVALAMVSVCGCASPGRPDARRARMSPGLLFNATPGPNPASFVRTGWPSTPRKWIVEEETATFRETTWDCQHGHGWRHGHSRSERQLRARAAN